MPDPDLNRRTASFIVLVLTIWAPVLWAAQEEPRIFSAQEWIEPPLPGYDHRGLPDPFASIIPQTEKPVEAVSPSQLKPLTPLEQVELSRIRLVGILWNPDLPQQAAAMVEIPDGTAFLLHEGTRIGMNRGEVVKILPDRVVVLEHIYGDPGQGGAVRRILNLREEENE